MVGTFLFNSRMALRFKGGPSVAAREQGTINRWVDTLGYVPVISRIILEKVGHAI
jgi:hypothetical protein